MRINESIHEWGRYDGESMFEIFIVCKICLHAILVIK